MTDYRKIITINPEKTRITVFDVLGWLASGMSKEEILEDFPELTEEDISACLSYAADKERKIRIA